MSFDEIVKIKKLNLGENNSEKAPKNIKLRKFISYVCFY